MTCQGAVLIDADSDGIVRERGKQFLKHGLVDKVSHAVKMRKYNQVWQQPERFDPGRLSACQYLPHRNGVSTECHCSVAGPCQHRASFMSRLDNLPSSRVPHFTPEEHT